MKVICPPDVNTNGNNEDFEFQKPAQSCALDGNSKAPLLIVAPLLSKGPQSDDANVLSTPLKEFEETNVIIAKRRKLLDEKNLLKLELELVGGMRLVLQVELVDCNIV